METKTTKNRKNQSQCSEINVFIRIVFLLNNYQRRERHITKCRKNETQRRQYQKHCLNKM